MKIICETNGALADCSKVNPLRIANFHAASVEVILLSEVDEQIDPASVSGLGELGNVSTNAAICNAIFNATGQRIRKLPVRLEQLDI